MINISQFGAATHLHVVDLPAGFLDKACYVTNYIYWKESLAPGTRCLCPLQGAPTKAHMKHRSRFHLACMGPSPLIPNSYL